MSFEISKHKLSLKFAQTVNILEGAEILSVGTRCVGEEINVVLFEKHEVENLVEESRTILMVLTDEEFSPLNGESARFISTVQVKDEDFHVFELRHVVVQNPETALCTDTNAEPAPKPLTTREKLAKAKAERERFAKMVSE
jgi:hypothetical protein